MEIIKRSNSSPTAPLKKKLETLETLYGSYNVHMLCEALDVSRGTFYNHIFRNKRNNTSYAIHREEIKVAIQKVFEDSKQIYGAGKIAAILKEQGHQTCEDTVRKLMHDMGLVSIRQRAKALYEQEKRITCKNILRQQFKAFAPNKIWISDVTCFRYNDLIFHTDRGSNYRSSTFVTYLKSLKAIQSFSRAHVPYDNSVMESFFASLKREELYRTRYRSENDLIKALDDYIFFYNTKRPYSSNNY